MRLLSLALLVLGTAIVPAAAQDLPDGPGKETFSKVCTQCHGVDIIVSLKHTKPEWKMVVDTMAGYGATAKDEEFAAIVDYLAKNFGTADAGAPAAGAAPAGQDLPNGSGKETFAKVCTQCHGTDIIISLKHTKPEWKTVVDTMASYGATAKDEEFDAIIDYLAKNFGKADAAAPAPAK